MMLYNLYFYKNKKNMPAKNPVPNIKENLGAAVIQIHAPAEALTKEHQAFNKLTKRIDTLQKKIASESKKMESLNALYYKEVFTKVLELGNHKIRLSHLLHEKRERIHLSRAQNEKLDDVILDLLDDAFSVIEPDEAAKKLYDVYSGGDFEDEAKEDEELMKSFFTEMLHKQFGLKIDPAMLNENPDFEKIEEDIKRQMAEKAGPQTPRKKTKKQLEREALEQQKEELKKKSLRSIYVSLAKLLHPDTEPDENLRIEKEEIMKKVTTAYDKKDMMELLRIEMQWVNTHKQSLDNTDVNTVAIYVQLLKDQVQQLEYELDMVYNNPKHAQVLEYKSYHENMAKLLVMETADKYAFTNQQIAGQIKAMEQSEFPSTPIKKCIEFYYLPDNDLFDQQMW
jgi:hypothetical protein